MSTLFIVGELQGSSEPPQTPPFPNVLLSLIPLKLVLILSQDERHYTLYIMCKYIQCIHKLAAYFYIRYSWKHSFTLAHFKFVLGVWARAEDPLPPPLGDVPGMLLAYSMPYANFIWHVICLSISCANIYWHILCILDA